MKLSKAEKFFYANAGYSYDPKTEAEVQGRERGAKLLASADAAAKADGMWFSWATDDITNREFTDEGPEYRLFAVVAYIDDDGPSHMGEPEHCGSLSGVDFGPDNSPNDGSRAGRYARVVEAELALEYYGEEL